VWILKSEWLKYRFINFKFGYCICKIGSHVGFESESGSGGFCTRIRVWLALGGWVIWYCSLAGLDFCVFMSFWLTFHLPGRAPVQNSGDATVFVCVLSARAFLSVSARFVLMICMNIAWSYCSAIEYQYRSWNISLSTEYQYYFFLSDSNFSRKFECSLHFIFLHFSIILCTLLLTRHSFLSSICLDYAIQPTNPPSFRLIKRHKIY